jgi:hypothetical membrane protein
MESDEKIFRKMGGGIFAILTLMVVAIGMLIALLIYLPVDPSYSILSNYISDLGAGPIGSRFAFGIGMALGAVFLIIFILVVSKYFKAKEFRTQLIWGYKGAGIVAEIGLLLIGFFPLDRALVYAYSMHYLGAVIFFSFTAISNIYLGFIEYKNSDFSKLMAIISFLSGIFSAIFIGGFVVQETELFPPYVLVYLSEWTFFALISIWLIIHGKYFWKKRD